MIGWDCSCYFSWKMKKQYPECSWGDGIKWSTVSSCQQFLLTYGVVGGLLPQYCCREFHFLVGSAPALWVVHLSASFSLFFFCLLVRMRSNLAFSFIIHEQWELCQFTSVEDWTHKGCSSLHFVFWCIIEWRMGYKSHHTLASSICMKCVCTLSAGLPQSQWHVLVIGFHCLVVVLESHLCRKKEIHFGLSFCSFLFLLWES